MAPHFPIVTQKDLKETRGDKSCSICCDDYAHGHIPVRTPCNHIFGQKCLAAWLADNDTCPMCRTNIVSDGFSELPSRHQSSRRDEPSTRSRAGTEASRASERSSQPQFSRVETLRNEPSARPRTGMEASRTAGAPSRLSVSSSQWDETHLPPSGSSHRSSHASRTAREAPTSSSHRSSLTSRTARESPSSSSHRSSHTSRAESSPMATLASLLRDSRNYDLWDDNRTNINTHPHAYPPFTRERLLEIVSDNYIARSNQDEIGFISDQLEQSDAREARGEDPFEPSEEYLSRESRYGHEIWIGRASSRRDGDRSGRESSSRHTGSSSRSGQSTSGRASSRRDGERSVRESSNRHTGNSSRSAQSTSSRSASRRTTISNTSDDDLEDAIRRLRL